MEEEKPMSEEKITITEIACHDCQTVIPLPYTMIITKGTAQYFICPSCRDKRPPIDWKARFKGVKIVMAEADADGGG